VEGIAILWLFLLAPQAQTSGAAATTGSATVTTTVTTTAQINAFPVSQLWGRSNDPFEQNDAAAANGDALRAGPKTPEQPPR
jgi:hypothetical protein